ncbi:uncharacterized protein L3040_005212 [Drepanopeziza brunnea f. sp. 'multigermtubi']|uniref:uncharacterized protein n=1 Tax=Drepanopeziza brunnea f. sp. 'multigermtubi' TaxID=698441 RepID=UPI0023940690|nr:hypothetical protein L3040_005212 [Drepanopeziza brunnea f. sp. 'multigermtubi']
MLRLTQQTFMPDFIFPTAVVAKAMRRRDMFQGMRWDLVDLQTTPWLNSTLEQLESIRNYWHASIRLLLGTRLVSNNLFISASDQDAPLANLAIVFSYEYYLSDKNNIGTYMNKQGYFKSRANGRFAANAFEH